MSPAVRSFVGGDSRCPHQGVTRVWDALIGVGMRAGITNYDINASVEIWRFFSKYDINGLVSSSTVVNENRKINRKLLQVVDLFGRQSTYYNNQLLFYIYDDGTVEKKIIIK